MLNLKKDVQMTSYNFRCSSVVFKLNSRFTFKIDIIIISSYSGATGMLKGKEQTKKMEGTNEARERKVNVD